MSSSKRGAHAVSRKLWIPLAALAVLLLAGATWYALTHAPMSEEEKKARRETCIASYTDRVYPLTTLDQCESANLYSEDLLKCEAWVTGDDSYCTQLPDQKYSFCLAMAAKDPDECDALEDDAIDYCKAYVLKDPTLCENSASAYSRQQCTLTIKGDTSGIRDNFDQYCDPDLAPAGQ